MLITIFAVVYYVCVYLILPFVLVWSWIVWTRSNRTITITVSLGLVGLALATLSVVLALATMAYARFVHPFPFYDPSLMRIYRYGFFGSLAGLILSLGGVWRRSPLQWRSPLCCFLSTIFWIGAAEAE